MKSTASVVYVEGLPGSGKTTLLDRLSRRYQDIQTVAEYVDPAAAGEAIEADDENYFLRNDERKYRVARSAAGLVLVDRGHLSTILYNEGFELVTGRQQVDVNTWYRTVILGQGMLPDAYIHLDTSPDTTFSRRPPTTDWDNMWDRREVLEHARSGYPTYMREHEPSIPVLRLEADGMTPAQVDEQTLAFLAATVGVVTP